MNDDRRGFFKKLFGIGALAVSGQVFPAEVEPIKAVVPLPPLIVATPIISGNGQHIHMTYTYGSATCGTVTTFYTPDPALFDKIDTRKLINEVTLG